MKKEFALLLSALALIAVMGCNDSRSNQTPTTTIEAPKEPPQPIGMPKPS